MSPDQVSRRPARRLTAVRPGPALMVAPGLAWFTAFFVVPALIFLVYSFLTPGLFTVSGPLTLDSFRSVVENELLRKHAWNSFLVGFPVAVVTLLVAVPVAYWLRYSARRMLIPVIFLFTASIFASYLVRIYSWRTMLGANGVVNEALERVGLIQEPLSFLLFSRFAVVLALVNMLMPIAVLVIFSAFRPLEAGYLEAARDLGARPWQVWTRTILPSIAVPLVTTGTLIFIIASADWVTPLLLGGGRATMLGQDVQQAFQVSGSYPEGAAMSFLMLACIAVAFVAMMLALRMRGLTGIRWGDAAVGAPRRSPVAGAITLLLLLYLYIPLLVVVLFSLHETTALSLPFEGFSLRWYDALFSDQVATTAMRTSATIAVIVAALTFALGTLTAFGLTRCSARVRGAVGGLLLAPLSLPLLFMGLALLVFFGRVGIQLSSTTIVIGHLLVTLPLFLLIARATLDRLDPAMEEAAADLGAGTWATFRRVTLPQIRPTLLGATAIAFATSFDEFAVTVFVAGQQATLPMFVWGRLRLTIDPLVNAVATLLLVVMFTLFAVGFAAAMFNERKRRRAAATPTEAQA